MSCQNRNNTLLAWGYASFTTQSSLEPLRLRLRGPNITLYCKTQHNPTLVVGYSLILLIVCVRGIRVVETQTAKPLYFSHTLQIEETKKYHTFILHGYIWHILGSFDNKTDYWHFFIWDGTDLVTYSKHIMAQREIAMYYDHTTLDSLSY